MIARCDRCTGDLYRPVVAFGRTFCDGICAREWAEDHPHIVSAYVAAFPRTKVPQ